MFITEAFAREYIEKYVDENIQIFNKENLIIHTVGEQGINLFELLNQKGIKVASFADKSPKLIGKRIYDIPVIDEKNIPLNSFIVVASPTTAIKDRNQLIYLGHKEEKIHKLYPSVIDYFHNEFMEKDKAYYANLTREQNMKLINDERLSEYKLESLPTQIVLDLTTKCNLNCCHCTDHHNKEVSLYRNQAENYVNYERYKFLFDYVNSIYLNISGEPLMAKGFWEMLDYIDESENDPFLFTVTNALLLDEKAADRIVNSKFKMLTISMDGATQKSYKRLRRGGDIELLHKNIKNLMKKRKESQRDNLEIRMLYTVQRENLEEIPLAVKLAGELGIDRFEIHPLYENIAGKETWVIPVDDEFTYYYPQQDISYYPNLTKKVIEEAKEIAEKYKVNFIVSPRFDYCYRANLEDIEYPMDVEEFKKIISNRKEEYKDPIKEDIQLEDIPYGELCNNPWDMAMLFLNDNIMYCNRMNQPQSNLNFSSFVDIRNSIVAQNVRKGLVERNLSWDCYYCSGCDYGDAVKRIPRDTVYLKRNDILDFNLNNSDLLREIKYTGISRIQRDGAWNNEREAVIEFNVEKDGNPFKVNLNGEAFVIPGLIDKQRVYVYVNDIKVDEFLYEDNKPTDKVINILEEQIIDNKIKIKMEFPDAISPLSLGLTRDDRERAIFIKNITLI